VNTLKTKKDAPDGESGSKRHKRTKGKLIRLDDVISEQDVKGGHQVLFALTDTTQTKTTKIKQ
jgi:hypothetical protein